MHFRLAMATLLLLFTRSAIGQELLLHLPLDGTLENRGSIPAEPTMYVDDGEEAPRFVPGQIGQGIEFNSRATIAVPFRLDYNDYPAVTITAWVKQALATDNTRAVIQSGRGPSLTITTRLTVNLGRTGVSFNEPMPRGEWIFVSAVLDLANGYVRLQQDEAVFVREGISPKAQSLKAYRLPNDPDGKRQPFIFVGALSFENWQQAARRVSMDDVRIYAGVLSDAQINTIRDTPQTETLPGEYSEGGSTLEEMQAEAAERNADRFRVDNESPTNALPSGESDSGLTLEEMQAEAAERNADRFRADIQSPTDVLPSGESGSGLTLEEMQAEAAERNADRFRVDIESPTDVLPNAGEQEETGNAQEGRFGGPIRGSGSQTVGGFLLDADFDREPSGNVRDCTSLSEVVSDLATTFRDTLVEAAATNACSLLTQPVASSQSASAIQDASGYETPEFVQQLMDETYDRCVSNTQAAAELPDRMVGFWNQLAGQNSWATIGPRELRFSETLRGNIIAPGDRKFISPVPLMGMGRRLNVALAEIEGRARVNMRVCHVSLNNRYSRLTSITINETPEEQANESQYIVETFDRVGPGYIVVYLDGSRLGRNFRYELTVDL